MAFANSNDYITGRKPVPTPQGAEVVATRFTLALGTADLALNDIGQIGILPAGCVPVDVFVDGTDMDSSTAAMVFQVGIGNASLKDAAGAVSADVANSLMSTVAGDGGGHWGVTASQNAAFNQRLTANGNAMALVTKSELNRGIVLKVATAPTTAVAGTVGVTVLYRNA